MRPVGARATIVFLLAAESSRAGVGYSRRAAAALAAVAFSIAALLLPATAIAQTQQDKAQLEVEKLQQEVRKLRLENDHTDGLSATLLRWGPFVTVVVGVVTVLEGVRRDRREQRRQRDADRTQRAKEVEERRRQAELDRQQREKELAQQELDARRHFDELFAQAVANLGSPTESVQLSAVILLESLLRYAEPEVVDQVYSVVCANLSVGHSVRVNRFLVRAFETALRLRLRRDEVHEPVDLANCNLSRVDLRGGVDLAEADIAFATLKDAKLVKADLRRARGYEVNLERAWLSEADLSEARLHGAVAPEAMFHRTRLVSAELRPSKTRSADLQRAEFFGASMQAAHLEGADLRGARFDGANVADAYFIGASFDDDALRSLVKAQVVKDVETWKQAHYDDAVRQRLEQLARRRGR